MAAKIGNKTAAYGRRFRQAVVSALAHADDSELPGRASRTLQRIASELVKKALKGEDAAIREVADRLDGKATQSIQAKIEHSVVDLRDADNLQDRLTEKLARRTEPVDSTVH